MNKLVKGINKFISLLQVEGSSGDEVSVNLVLKPVPVRSKPSPVLSKPSPKPSKPSPADSVNTLCNEPLPDIQVNISPLTSFFF